MVREVTERDVGLKVIHDPQEQDSRAKIDVDILAIHGLGAHPDDTWTKERSDRNGKRYVNWLSERDMLPAELPNARVLRYGYHSKWFGDSAVCRGFNDIAKDLLYELLDKPVNRPLILVAHSYGGLVATRAVSLAFHDMHHYSAIAERFAGLIFFGVPFRGADGMDVNAMIALASSVNKQHYIEPSLIQSMQPNSESLQELVDGFTGIWSYHKTGYITCFYELQPSEVGKLFGQNGQRQIVVSEAAGCLNTWGRVEKLALVKDHFNMNKFASPDEGEFRRVMQILRKTADAAISQSNTTSRPQMIAHPNQISNQMENGAPGNVEDVYEKLFFPLEYVKKNCPECKRLSIPKENEWEPCPKHCKDCPLSKGRGWPKRLFGVLSGKDNLVLACEYEELCKTHQEDKRRREKQRRLEREELRRIAREQEIAAMASQDTSIVSWNEEPPQSAMPSFNFNITSSSGKSQNGESNTCQPVPYSNQYFPPGQTFSSTQNGTQGLNINSNSTNNLSSQIRNGYVTAINNRLSPGVQQRNAQIATQNQRMQNSNLFSKPTNNLNSQARNGLSTSSNSGLFSAGQQKNTQTRTQNQRNPQYSNPRAVIGGNRRQR